MSAEYVVEPDWEKIAAVEEAVRIMGERKRALKLPFRPLVDKLASLKEQVYTDKVILKASSVAALIIGGLYGPILIFNTLNTSMQDLSPEMYKNVASVVLLAGVLSLIESKSDD